jgi:hypothetical protein
MMPSVRKQLPVAIGGDRVKLLIGIRSSSLAPVQRFSLPSGLGVFQSSLVDVYGASICFGGPHEVFTKGYARAGVSANHLQVYFTEIARAYMRAPHTFVCRFPKSKPPPSQGAVCFAHDLEDHDCPDQDIRLRTQPNWGGSSLALVSVARSECSTTLMRIGDVTRKDCLNDFAGWSILPRPNPDWCDSGPAPIPASRGGSSDANPNQM